MKLSDNTFDNSLHIRGDWFSTPNQGQIAVLASYYFDKVRLEHAWGGCVMGWGGIRWLPPEEPA